MILSKTISTEIDQIKRRVIKVLSFGRGGARTALEASPYGIDSNPIKDMQAIYSITTDNSKPVIIGYINKNQKAEPGEIRHYSTDENGDEKFYTWLKSDGTMEMGGVNDFMVRYIKLNAGLQNQVSEINIELGKIAVAINAIVPLSYIPTAITLDISQSKITEIKTL